MKNKNIRRHRRWRAGRAGLAGLVCFLLMACRYSLGAETLEQAWSHALQVDHTLAAARQREQAAADGLAAASAHRLPSVDLVAGYTRLQNQPSAAIEIPALHIDGLPFAQQRAYDGALKVSLPLYTGGRIDNGIAAAGALGQAAGAASQSSRQALKLAVAEAYVSVLRARSLQRVARSHVSAIERHADDLKQLFEQGYAARADLLATQVALADARQQALVSANGVALACAAYNRLQGRAQTQPVELIELSELNETGSDSPDLEALLAQSTRRSELGQLSAQETALRRQAASINGQGLPQIALSGGWGKLEDRYLVSDKGWWIGVALQWTLFDGGQVRREASQQAANAQALAELRADAASQIELQVRQAWLQLREAGARIELAQAALAQADELLDLARERYRAGLAPNSEVLDAEARRVGAHANHDNAGYDRALAGLRLRYASGQL